MAAAFPECFMLKNMSVAFKKKKKNFLAGC